MKLFSLVFKSAGVYGLVTLVSFLGMETAWAAGNGAAAPATATPAAAPPAYPPGYTPIPRKERVCDSLQSKASDSESAFLKACAAAKMGAEGDCLKAISECIRKVPDSADEEEDGVDWASMLGGLSSAFPMMSQVASSFSDPQPSKANPRCPAMPEKEFREKKRDLEDQVSRGDEDLAKIDKDTTQVKKDLDDKISQLDKDIEESRKKLAEDKTKKAEQKEDAQKEFAKSQSELSKAIADAQRGVEDKKGALARYEARMARDIANMSIKAAKISCEAQVSVAAAKLLNPGGTDSNAPAPNISGKKIQDYRNEAYALCINNFTTSKQQKIQERDLELEKATREINDLVANIARMQQDMTTAEKQNTTLLTRLQNEENQAVTDQATQEQRMTAQKATATQNATAEVQALAQKKAALSKRVASYKKELARNAGERPAAGATGGWVDAQTAAFEYYTAVESYVTSPACCSDEGSIAKFCNMKKTIADLKGKVSGSRTPSSRTSGSSGRTR